MATKYRHVFEFEADELTCGFCPLWHRADPSDEMFSYCIATNTERFEQKDFSEWRGRLKDCPLKEVKE